MPGKTIEIFEGLTINPDVMAGKLVIKGTRMPVQLVLAKLAANPDLNEFFLDYPELTEDQVKSCLNYAAQMVKLKETAMRRKAMSGSAPTSA